MSFTSHVWKGGAIGFTTGGIMSSYFSYRAQRMSAERGEIAALPYFGLFLGCGLGGGPAGALTGAALYGTKKGFRYLRRAPRPVQAIFLGTVTASAYGGASRFNR